MYAKIVESHQKSAIILPPFEARAYDEAFVQPEMLRRAADALEGGFHWLETPEGYDFWRQIRDRLNAIAAAAEYKKMLNVPAIREAAKLLFDAFPWHETPEGFEYWAEVHRKLEMLAKEPS